MVKNDQLMSLFGQIRDVTIFYYLFIKICFGMLHIPATFDANLFQKITPDKNTKRYVHLLLKAE